jgi:integrase
MEAGCSMTAIDLSNTQVSNAASVAQLSKQADVLATMSKSETTQRAYRSAWGGFTDWCRSHDLDPLGGNPETVALYVADRVESLSISTISVHIAAIKEAYRLSGTKMDFDAPRLQMVLSGARRVKGIKPARKAAPAVPDVLRPLLATRQPSSTPVGARDRALFLLGFGAALRRSELVALRVGDIVREPGRGLIVTVRRSKTDANGVGADVAICENVSNSAFCPSRAFADWMVHRVLGPDGGGADRPLFCAINKAGHLSGEDLFDRTVARLLQDAAGAAGLDPSLFSGHSLRRGFATAAANSGIGLRDMMRQTRHKSTRVALGYIEEASKWDGNASALVFV